MKLGVFKVSSPKPRGQNHIRLMSNSHLPRHQSLARDSHAQQESVKSLKSPKSLKAESPQLDVLVILGEGTPKHSADKRPKVLKRRDKAEPLGERSQRAILL